MRLTLLKEWKCVSMKNSTEKSALALTFSLGLLLCQIQGVFAQDWPQWRNPNRDGILPHHLTPKSIPVSLSKV